MLPGEICAEFGCGSVIWLNSDNVASATSQGAGDNARSSADLYDGVTFFDVGMTNKHECQAW